MKLIVHVLAVITLAVFRTDCRERPNVREMSDDDHNRSDDLGVLDDRDLSNDGELSNSLDVSYGPDLSDGPNSESSTSFPYAHLYSTQNNRELSNVVDLPNSRGVSYGPELSAGPNNESSTSFPYAHLFSNRVNVDIPAVEVVPGLVPDGFENYDFSVLYHQQKEDERVQNEGKLRGGSKCKPDIVCSLLGGSCVNNSTYCAGREVSSLCNGAKCKCCIPVTLEVKVHELETEVQSMVVNLTVAKSNLHTDINSMVNSLMSNLTIANANMVDLMNTSNTNLTSFGSEMKNDLQVITENLTNANGNQVSKLESIIERQDTQKTNLASLNSNMKNEHQAITNNLNNANGNLLSKVNSIREHQAGCPDGLFFYGPSNQCFRLLGRMNWDSAKSACSALGLTLAHPYDPISLRAFLVTKYGLDNVYMWLGARGSGSAMKWLRTGKAISTGNPLWWPGGNGRVTTAWCLTLLTYAPEWKSHPMAVYWPVGCTSSLWTLCEKVI